MSSNWTGQIDAILALTTCQLLVFNSSIFICIRDGERRVILEKNQTEHFKGSIYLLCAFTLAGTSVISARYLSGKLGVFTITAVSLLLGFLFLVAICAKKLIRTVRSMGVRDWGILFLQALFGIFLFRMFLLQGLLRTSTAEAGILTGAAPALTALLALTILREPVSAKGLVGIFSTMGGIILIQGVVSSGGQFSMEHMWGNMLVLCAAASESLFNVLSRLNHVKNTHRQEASFDPLVQTALVTGIAGILSTGPALFENPLPAIGVLGMQEWLALLWYGVFVTALAFIFWYAGIKRSSASAAAAFSGMMPFMSLLLSVTILRERAGLPQWLGGALIVLGMILIGTRKESSRKPSVSRQKSPKQAVEKAPVTT